VIGEDEISVVKVISVEVNSVSVVCSGVVSSVDGGRLISVDVDDKFSVVGADVSIVAPVVGH